MGLVERSCRRVKFAHWLSSLLRFIVAETMAHSILPLEGEAHQELEQEASDDLLLLLRKLNGRVPCFATPAS